MMESENKILRDCIEKTLEKYIEARKLISDAENIVSSKCDICEYFGGDCRKCTRKFNMLFIGCNEDNSLYKQMRRRFGKLDSIMAEIIGTLYTML
jgi:hypothetical protein